MVWVGDTNHGRWRRAQRGISAAQVLVVQRFGRKSHQAGGKILFYVGKRELACLRAAGEDVELCANLAVVFSRDGFLVTAFRSSDYRRARLSGVLGARGVSGRGKR